jgi:hypothetical protein
MRFALPYLLLALLGVTIVYAILSPFMRQPLRYRDRLLTGTDLPPVQTGSFEIFPLRMTFLRLGLFALLSLLPVTALFEAGLLAGIPIYLGFQLSLFILILQRLDRSVPVVKVLHFRKGEIVVDFQQPNRFPDAVFQYPDIGSYCDFISCRYYGYGGQRPYKGVHLGTGVFDRNGTLIFLIPVYIRDYWSLRTWIQSSLPLKNEPPVLTSKR